MFRGISRSEIEKPLGLFERNIASNEVPQTPKAAAKPIAHNKNALQRRANFVVLVGAEGFELTFVVQNGIIFRG